MSNCRKRRLNCLNGFLLIIFAASISCNIFYNQPEAELVDTILVTKNLQVGQQRVSLLLNVDSGKEQAPNGEVSVRLDADSNVIEKKIAEYHSWPYGMRGAYSTYMNFVQPGPWEMEILLDVGGVKCVVILVDCLDLNFVLIYTNLGGGATFCYIV